LVRRGEGRSILTIASLDQIFQNPVQVLHNIVVDVSNYAKAKRLHIGLALLILHDLISIGMTVAVYLDDERLFRAIEVHNVWPNAVLPSKLEPLKLSCS
jgi:hypothetical protein